MRLSSAFGLAAVVFCVFQLMKSAGCDLYVSRPKAQETVSSPIQLSQDPIQSLGSLPSSIPIYVHGIHYTLTPVAQYQISGRVVSTKRYYINEESFLSPVDVALVWGDLSDPKKDKDIRYDHGQRFYHYRYSANFPLPQSYIAQHSSNNHIIPANKTLADVAKTLKNNELVTLEGYLVNVSDEKGGSWKTSTTRDDTGGGACELIYLTRVRVGNSVYQ